MAQAFKIPSWEVGIILVIICLFIYIGGIKRLASVTEKIVPIGTLISSDFVWELTDMFNNLMVIPNVIALFALTKLVKSCMENNH